jgi:hypothetical protein
VRVADFASVGLLILALVAFAFGLYELGSHDDLAAIYWLVVGGLSLRAATNVLRPRGGVR